MTSETIKNCSPAIVVSNPFDVDEEEEVDGYELEELFDPHGLVEDMTGHANIEGKALRVELRECRSVLGLAAKKHNKKIPEDAYLLGLVEERNLPVDGEVFYLKYHNRNGEVEYGSVSSGVPVSSTVEDDNYIYFNTSEGEWRLEIKDSGN